MKDHKLAEIIKLWADGARIQVFNETSNEWDEVDNHFLNKRVWFDEAYSYRVHHSNFDKYYLIGQSNAAHLGSAQHHLSNLKVTFDGNTGAPIKAEII